MWREALALDWTMVAPMPLLQYDIVINHMTRIKISYCEISKSSAEAKRQNANAK